ncbi:response regulator transcription factor [Clostridium sp. YIM B02515]|uniref:Stage 0 sporulation protein A homolog n=1 Tax=Clostridium rhizosphaerae TaxID=2803861 RepID=A0ABS1T5F4_9CLOT|nr:response regulator transcription factor [Clostridium rhizosphaerae]MBL4934563.1 response regulator transcription factor [Clostridium rhizosphaerae]
MPNKILIVDDDNEIRKITGIYLENEGYEVLKAENGEQALKIIAENDIDLVLLDIMMPVMNGIEACMKIREDNIMPIIFLSAKSEDLDKIQGLASGADDYITKPFNAMELLARVKSQLRRYTRYSTPQNAAKNIIEVGNLTINTDTRQVLVGDKEIRLTPKEFDILELLARNKGIVFSIEKIYERVWGEEFYKSDNTIMVHITKIREKIEEDPKKPVYIKTVWGVGYKI